MKVGIISKEVFDRYNLDVLSDLIAKLSQANIEVWFHKRAIKQITLFDFKVETENVFSDDLELISQFDYVISVGGDGTILRTLQVIKDTCVPVIGINAGRLGFLATLQPEEIDLLVNCIKSRSFDIQKRSLLKLESYDLLFKDFPYALNDFVIHKKDTSSMITVKTFLNGEFLNSYWADGLIVSTPTGSSGYNMSCGGPIVFPGADSLVITPIAPHNLNLRPVVISDDYVISFEIEGRSESFLVSLDSRSESITSEVQLGVKKADFYFHLAFPQDRGYFYALRHKLMWGIDRRN